MIHVWSCQRAVWPAQKVNVSCMVGFAAMLLNVNMLESKVINMHHHIAPYLSTGNSLSLRWNIAVMHRDLGTTWCKPIVTVHRPYVTHLVFIVEFGCLKNLVYFLFSYLSNMPLAMFSKQSLITLLYRSVYNSYLIATASLSDLCDFTLSCNCCTTLSHTVIISHSVAIQIMIKR